MGDDDVEGHAKRPGKHRRADWFRPILPPVCITRKVVDELETTRGFLHSNPISSMIQAVIVTRRFVDNRNPIEPIDNA